MRKKIWLGFLFFFLGISDVYAASDLDSYNFSWTGPIFAGPGQAMPPGHINIEPYLFMNNVYGRYSKNWEVGYTSHLVSIIPLISIIYGLFEDVEMQLIAQEVYNHLKGASYTHIGDTQLKLGYELVKERKNSWVPYVKLVLTETFPSGKYNHLNPALFDTDSTGSGTYTTDIGLNFQKLIILPNQHPLRLRGHIDYGISSPVCVEGFNAYGGGVGTKGTVRPGNLFTSILSFEYGITRHWVFAMDLLFRHFDEDRFNGTPGTPGGFIINPSAGDSLIFSTVGNESSENLSATPSFEYNYDEHVGIIMGVWVSFAGRNSLAFFSPVIAINVIY